MGQAKVPVWVETHNQGSVGTKTEMRFTIHVIVDQDETRTHLSSDFDEPRRCLIFKCLLMVEVEPS